MTAVDYPVLLELAETDAGFRERVLAAYAGRHDPGEALWWYRHPLAASPAGTESPSAGLAALERLVFSSRERSREVVAAEVRLREATAAIAADRAEVEAALEYAAGAEGDGSAAGAGRRVGVGPDSSLVLARDLDLVETDAAVPGESPRRVVVVAGIVLLGVGIALGSGLPRDAAETGPDAAPSASAAARPTIEPVLALFDEVQGAEDIPSMPLATTILPESTRRVGQMELMSMNDIFVARNTSNRICLIAYESSPTPTGAYASSCVSELAFPVDGLRVGWPAVSSIQDQSTNDVVVSIVDLEYILRADGTVEGGGSGRP